MDLPTPPQEHENGQQEEQKPLGLGDFQSAPSAKPTVEPTPRKIVAASGPPPAKISSPTHGPRRAVVWLMLLACLLVTCPPLFLELGTPDVVAAEEARMLAASVETWQAGRAAIHDGNGKPAPAVRSGLESLVPYLNNDRQLERPPGVVWAHLAAFVGLGDPVNVSTPTLIWCARLTSVIFALTLVATVFWAGHSVGGPIAAVLAALVCAANPVFLYHSRLADGAAQQAAFILLAIAAALWAIRPLRPAPSVERQFIGWVVCGLACGAAIYTAGPWTILHILVPVMLVLILVPGRVSHLMGLLAALLIGVLMVGPWGVYAYSLEPEASRSWLDLFTPRDWTDMGQLGEQSAHRLAVLLLVKLPWTLWLIGAVMQPFSTSSAGTRLRLLLGWVWFIAAAGLVMFSPWPVISASGVDQLVAVPAAAVLIGQMFSQYAALASEGRYARLWRWLRWPHVALPLLVSVLLPIALLVQGEVVARRWPDPIVDTPPWYWVLAIGVVLLAVWGAGLRWTVQHYPARALVLWSVWTLILCTAMVFPLVNGPLAQSAVPNDAAALTTQVTTRDVFWLQTSQHPEPDPTLLLYTRRSIIPVSTEALPELAAKVRPLYVLTRRGEEIAHGGTEKILDLNSVNAVLLRIQTPESP